MWCTGFGITAIRTAGLLSILFWMFEAQAGEITPDLARSMAHRGTHADTSVILHFTDPVDLNTVAVGDRSRRDNRLLLALKSNAERNRAAVDSLLAAAGAGKIKDLWMVNALAATVPAISVKRLAAHPAVARIDLDSFVQGGRSQRTPRSRTLPGAEPIPLDPMIREAATAMPANIANANPGWNLVMAHVPEVWALGQTGAGVVVASMDTGVDLAHPALKRKWRGGSNSWYDPHGEEVSPYDALGHGTQALGVIAGGPDIGIAPDVRWIAARLYNGDGKASMSDLHMAFQWLMDPDGNPATIDAPDIVNASWALTGRGLGTCILEFADDIRALRSAGIVVVLAAGNDGPFANTSNSPGNNPGVLSVGAVDRDMEQARQTSRGPSACDGSTFPKLLAPGVNIRTTDLSHGGTPSYTTVSGSSLAAPHAAGILALLAGAFPRASVDELEKAMMLGAIENKDKTTKHVDALGAYTALLGIREFVTNRPASQALSR